MDIFAPVRNTVLVVDDEITSLSQLCGVLREHYQVKMSNKGENALLLAQREQPDLILLDTCMPGLDGYEVCRQLKANALTQHIPVILLTDPLDSESADHGLQLGAIDYLSRPVRPAILRARVHAYLAEAEARRVVRANHDYVEFEVHKRALQLTAMQDVIILAMASLAETRDTDTGNHLRRTQNYVRLLAQALQTRPGYAEHLSDAAIDVMYRCAPLHDIGKVGIPDRILLKEGRYTEEEYTLMKRHPALGRAALVNAQRMAGNTTQALSGAVDFFGIAGELIYSHHEKWDGTGYPQGLRGPAIPIAARLMSLADVYDALISPRVYKPALSHARATQIIVEGRSKFFDPVLVDTFLELSTEFQEVAHRFADSPLELEQKYDFVISALGGIELES